MKTWLVLAVAMGAGVAARSSQESVPREWIDPDTGHRVVRLSDEPGSQSLYFHQYAYTPDGKKPSHHDADRRVGDRPEDARHRQSRR